MAEDTVQICQIFPHYAPVLAGAAERFRRYAPGLAARGVKTSVITSRSDPALAAQEKTEGCVEAVPYTLMTRDTTLHVNTH